MESWKQIVLILYALVNLAAFLKGYYETKHKKNPFGLTPYLNLFGIIVWGDAVIFGPFWVGVSFISYLLKDWLLFLLIISVFLGSKRIG